MPPEKSNPVVVNKNGNFASSKFPSDARKKPIKTLLNAVKMPGNRTNCKTVFNILNHRSLSGLMPLSPLFLVLSGMDIIPQ